MEKVEGLQRPMGLLQNWLETYGYDKHRVTGEDCMAMCYLSTQSYDEDGEATDEWHLVGINREPYNALVEGFQDIMKMLLNEYGKGRLALNINGIVLVSHGVGRYMFVNEDEQEVEVEDIPEEMRESVCESGVFAGTRPVRIINTITSSGLAAEIATFDENGEPDVQYVEHWTGSGEMPKASGMVDEALMSLMTFSLLCRQVVSNDLPMNARSLLEVAMEGETDERVMSYVLKIVSMALDVGLLESEDLT
jgi:hypothetical protein